jgi:putative acetyltransferase
VDFQINIRTEQERDFASIHKVIQSAFEIVSYSNQKEHLLVDAMREAGALEVSLVADLGGKIVGHIAFSEVTIIGKNCAWFGLAPVSVHPEYQNKGIGSKLILECLDRIKKSGAKGCVLLGEPEYYHQFGLKQLEQLKLQGVPPEYFLIKSFTANVPTGMVE